MAGHSKNPRTHPYLNLNRWRNGELAFWRNNDSGIRYRTEVYEEILQRWIKEETQPVKHQENIGNKS